MTRHDLWRDGRLPVRLALTADLFGWSAVLSGPEDVFARSHSYDHLARWAAEAQWAWLFGLAGLLCAFGVLSTNRALRTLGAMVACTMQAAITVSFGWGLQVPTGFGAYLGLVLMSIWLVWRELGGG